MESILVNSSTVKAELINARGQKYPAIEISTDRIVKQSLALDEKFADFYVDNQFNAALNIYRQFRKKGLFHTLEYIRSAIKFREAQKSQQISQTSTSSSFASSSSQQQQQHGQQQSSSQDDNSDYEGSVSWSSSIILSIIWLIFAIQNICCIVYYYFYPSEKLSDTELIIKHHSNAEWKDGILRSFSWHPRQCRCAVALSNDLIFVYASDYKRPVNHSVGLKHVQQRNITSMDWHPKCDFILAISCKDKILIWTLDSDIESFIPDPNACVKAIQTPLGSPINCVRFHPDGHLLAASSSRCSAIFLMEFEWKNSKEYSFKRSIRRIFFSPTFTNLTWSPDGSRLVAQTTSAKLIIFETYEWSHRTLRSNLNEPCQALAWSMPKAKYLIYAPKESSKIYALPFYDKADKGYVGGDRQSMLLVDLQEQEFDDEVTGKIVQDFVWSRDSTILVVLFKDKPSVLGVYGTSIGSLITIWPLCTIKAHFEDLSVRAQMIRFHHSYVDNDSSLLSVCWSNGIVTNLPLTNQCEFPAGTESPRSLTAVCRSFTTTPTRADTSMNRTGRLDKSTVQSPLQNKSLSGSILSNSVSSHRRNGLFSTRLQFD